MGIARLLAKGWIIFCLYAGAHALRLALLQGQDLASSLPGIGICALLFIAMGLLFVGGFGVSAAHVAHTPWIKHFKPRHLIPGFNEGVFFIFVVFSFLIQAFVAPGNIDRGAVSALQNAIYFVVPGQRALVSARALGPRTKAIFRCPSEYKYSRAAKPPASLSTMTELTELVPSSRPIITIGVLFFSRSANRFTFMKSQLAMTNRPSTRRPSSISNDRSKRARLF